jgi:hypothetical protein
MGWFGFKKAADGIIWVNKNHTTGQFGSLKFYKGQNGSLLITCYQKIKKLEQNIQQQQKKH